MLPDRQSHAHEQAGQLVDIDPSSTIDVVLYEQQWKLRSPGLDRITAAVLDTARSRLVP